MFGRVIVGLLIAGGGMVGVYYAPKLAQWFGSSDRHAGVIRGLSFGIVVIGFLVLFGMLNTSTTGLEELPVI